MAYAGKCDRCGGFYDIPFEHGAPIRARMVDVFDDPVETNISFNDFKARLYGTSGGGSQPVRSGAFESRGELEATIKDSISIIENFKP